MAARITSANGIDRVGPQRYGRYEIVPGRWNPLTPEDLLAIEQADKERHAAEYGEKDRARLARYYQRHKDEIRIRRAPYQQQYRELHRDEIIQKRREQDAAKKQGG